MFMITGTWTGYVSSQMCVAHRSFHNDSEKSLKAWAQKTFAIIYTDGTSLQLRVTEGARKNKSLPANNGYMSLIYDCMDYGVNQVAKLPNCDERVIIAHHMLYYNALERERLNTKVKKFSYTRHHEFAQGSGI